MKKYDYAGDLSFEDAYHDCKLVDDSIVDAKSFQEADTGLLLYCMDRILEALEKQVAKEAIIIADKCSDGEFMFHAWECPSCGQNYVLDFGKSDYCPNCGQKLNWGLDV